MHAEVGRQAAELAVDELLIVGADAQAIADGVVQGKGTRVRMVSDVDAAVAVLAETTGDDVVLVKASNSEQLWRVADQLLSSAATTVSA